MPEEMAKIGAVREQFRHYRPTLEQLLATGDYTEPVLHGQFLDLLSSMSKLKQERVRAGLSLADVSKLSGIDSAALSRLENGQQPNPTLDTLYRYAGAVGKEIVWSFRDAQPSRAKAKPKPERQRQQTVAMGRQVMEVVAKQLH